MSDCLNCRYFKLTYRGDGHGICSRTRLTMDTSEPFTCPHYHPYHPGDPPEPEPQASPPEPGPQASPPGPREWPEWPDKAIDAIAFNRVAETRFRALLDDCVGMVVSAVIAETSFRLDISPETARRYLQKYTASSAPWGIERGYLSRRSRA